MIYLDHAATTPLDPRVLESMLPYLKEHFGNASSIHAMGRKARVAVEDSRERIAALLGVAPAEIIFTSGGTEADNLALNGRLHRTRGHLITSAVEHKAILEPANAWKRAGGAVTILRPTSMSTVLPDQLAETLMDGDTLVSLMYANNELGTLTPIAAVGQLCHQRGPLCLYW